MISDGPAKDMAPRVSPWYPCLNETKRDCFLFRLKKYCMTILIATSMAQDPLSEKKHFSNPWGRIFTSLSQSCSAGV
ncbi:hypothetical protein CP10743SC13_0821 [Chlamydia psittaci 10_743_SC13]|nr:hypothetical protein CP10743SC13_0821 [Chlamydia psittaci 10_743_SC13]